MKLFNTIFLAGLLLMAGQAMAHTDEFLDTQPAPHGGQIRMTDTYHLELVLKDKDLTVYVMNHANEPQPSAGMVATATILSDGKKTDIKLEPTEDNQLKGSGDFVTKPDMKVMLTVTPAPQTARFTPFQKATSGSAEKSSDAVSASGHEGHDMSKMQSK